MGLKELLSVSDILRDPSFIPHSDRFKTFRMTEKCFANYIFLSILTSGQRAFGCLYFYEDFESYPPSFLSSFILPNKTRICQGVLSEILRVLINVIIELVSKLLRFKRNEVNSRSRLRVLCVKVLHFGPRITPYRVL